VLPAGERYRRAGHVGGKTGVALSLSHEIAGGLLSKPFETQRRKVATSSSDGLVVTGREQRRAID